MRILVAEDQPEKAEVISRVLKNHFKLCEIVTAESLRSALSIVLSADQPALIILDMSMPNFPLSSQGALEAEPESFAGQELMKQMHLRNIEIPTVVVTQYSSFEKDSVTLQELDDLYKLRFSNFYIGSVYYSSTSSQWKKELYTLLPEKLS